MTIAAKPPKPVAAPARAAADANASLLLRKAEDGYAFPALDAVATRFARSLRDLLRALGAPAVQVEPAGAAQLRFAAWCDDAAPAIFWRYHAPPLKGPVLLAASRPLILQLVDIFYGGKGQLAAEREELTDAEDRFAARLGRDMGLQLAAAWAEKLPIEPALDCVTANPAKLAAVRADDEMLVQRYTLRGGRAAAPDAGQRRRPGLGRGAGQSAARRAAAGSFGARPARDQPDKIIVARGR